MLHSGRVSRGCEGIQLAWQAPRGHRTACGAARLPDRTVLPAAAACCIKILETLEEKRKLDFYGIRKPYATKIAPVVWQQIINFCFCT